MSPSSCLQSLGSEGDPSTRTPIQWVSGSPQALPWQGGPRCRPSWVPASCWIFLGPSGTAGIHPAASAGPWRQAGRPPAPTAGPAAPPRVPLPPARPHPAAPCPRRAWSQEGARHGSKEGLGARCEPWGGFGSHRFLSGTVAWPHRVSRMLQVQTRRLVAQWHGHTVCLGCSRLSHVPLWHRGVSTLCVRDAPGSAISLRGTVACPRCVSGMLQAQPCPSVAPWRVHTVCPGCSRLSHVLPWHCGVATLYVHVARGSAWRFAVCPGRAPLPFREQLPPQGQQGGQWQGASEGPRARAAGCTPGRRSRGGPAPCAGCWSQTVV